MLIRGGKSDIFILNELSDKKFLKQRGSRCKKEKRAPRLTGEADKDKKRNKNNLRKAEAIFLLHRETTGCAGGGIP